MTSAYSGITTGKDEKGHRTDQTPAKSTNHL